MVHGRRSTGYPLHLQLLSAPPTSAEWAATRHDEVGATKPAAKEPLASHEPIVPLDAVSAEGVLAVEDVEEEEEEDSFEAFERMRAGGK